jgi:hypothetical protein
MNAIYFQYLGMEHPSEIFPAVHPFWEVLRVTPMERTLLPFQRSLKNAFPKIHTFIFPALRDPDKSDYVITRKREDPIICRFSATRIPSMPWLREISGEPGPTGIPGLVSRLAPDW